MQTFDLGSTLLILLVIFVVFALAVAWAEGLAFFAPKSTRRLAGPAEVYCTGHCRLPDGRCPLSESTEPAANCPLWRFVAEDIPTVLYGSPFEHLRRP